MNKLLFNRKFFSKIREEIIQLIYYATTNLCDLADTNMIVSCVVNDVLFSVLIFEGCNFFWRSKSV